MSGLFAIYRREMLTYWVTPLAWVLLFVFLLLQGLSFGLVVSHFASMAQLSLDSGPVQAYFGESLLLLVSLLLLCAALPMRSFAEERRSGSIEALLTAPVSSAGVVLGKYLATLSTYGLMWVPTLLYVVILRDTGQVDWQVVASSYLGVLGLGAGFLAIGTLMSSLTQSQLIAFMLTATSLFGLFILGIGSYVFDPGLLHSICAHVSVQDQLQELSKGVVDLRRIVLDLTLIVLPLFLTVRIVESWRWD